MTLRIFEFPASASITRTFDDPDETAIYAQLVRLAVTSTRAQRVLDVGCGSGVATLEAARAGAREVVGIDSELTSIDMARVNIRQARQKVHVSAHFACWEDVFCGRFPACPDLLVSNPPYVPGGVGPAVDGGFFGTSLLNHIIDHVPSSARAVALLFGSITDPLTFLSRVAKRGFEVTHLTGHSVPFGTYTSRPSTLRHLRFLREHGRAFFCDGPNTRGRAPHAYLTMGMLAHRNPGAPARASALLEAARSRLLTYQEEGMDHLSAAPRRAAS